MSRHEPTRELTRSVADGIDALRRDLDDILARAATGGWSSEAARADVERLAAAAGSLARVEARQRGAQQAEAEHINDILEVFYGMASLDFGLRAPVRADGPLDALATAANMLAEELEAAHHAMTEARVAAEAATVAKSRFLAQMSHEIRTPLTALIGFADLLAAPDLSESERLNYAMIIRRNGEHLLSVINDILDLSKIEAGRLQLEVIECSPAQVLADVASLMRVRATEGGLGFEVRVATPIPAVVRTDPTRLRQVLLNLVGNAVKFTPRGGRVEVVVRHHADAARLEIAVVDTGIGMTPEQVGELFHPFQQADLSMSRRFGGTGLGLAICKAVAEALGGTIAVDSAVGQGSTFTFGLAVEVAPDAPMVSGLAAAPLAAAAPAPTHRFAGAVLLVEDGPDNQVLVSTLLRKLGLTVGVVDNGQLGYERAVAAWRAGTPYDLVLMDMQMPVLDGYQATRMLRRDGYPGPIVALTAHAMEGERERCLAAGCDGFVRKPIDRAALVDTLATYLRRAEPAGAALAGPPVVSEFADDPDMRELVTRFAESLPERGDALRVAASARDPGLPRLVHQLKGAAGGYGFPSISEAAARLEAELTGAADPTAVARLLDALLGLCARARAGSA